MRNDKLSPSQENTLFESLVVNQPQLQVYLLGELDDQIKVLVSMNDTEQLRRAQGHAQALQRLVTKLDSARDRLRRS